MNRMAPKQFFSPTWVACAAAALCLCLPATAQKNNNDVNPNANNLPIQRIGVDDLISIQVYDSPELTRTERVSQDGSLRLPLMAKSVPAAGLYPAQLEKSLSDELKTEGILVRPIVSVTVSEYRSRPINVVGSVRHPLTFQAAGTVTLLEAINRADGLTEGAGQDIIVTKPSATPGGAPLVQRINTKQLIDGGDPALNIRLDGGEEVRVPEAGRVYVVGNIKHPGALPMRDPSETTVLRVIAQSEGLMPYASKNAFILRHGDTPNNQIPIPLGKIMERKSPDVQLEANDVLYIPDDRAKRNTARALDTLTGFGVGTMSGLLIWKH